MPAAPRSRGPTAATARCASTVRRCGAPEPAYLYHARRRGAGPTQTSSSTCTPQPFGVRTVAVDGHRFLINGEPFHFTGFGMHEDFAVHGRGHDLAVMVHDFELLKWVGANSFRTSHYPYDEAVLDYADRHGVVVIDETAAVGLNLDTGTPTSSARARRWRRSATPRSTPHAGGPPPGDPRACRARQEPPVRRDLEHRQRARRRAARGAGVL